MKTVLELIGMKEAKAWKGKFTPKDCSNPDQMVGLEIETEGCNHEAAWYVQHLSKLWDVKTDASLRGRNNGQLVAGDAYEFISKPAGIGTTLAELEEFYRVTGIVEANYTDRCSIHVHTNVQDMTPHQVATLCLVYPVVEEVLFEFVNHFKVEDPRGAYRDTNIYCVPWGQCRMNHQMVSNMFNDLDYTFSNWQKYTSLNLIPARKLGTVEWRHMHGTADLEKITIWLNVIGSILKYAKSKTFEEVVDTIKSLNDNSAYRQFYQDVLGGYIPFDPKYEVAICTGVVNAKYALIGLKDYTVKEKKKTKSALEMMVEMQQQEAAGVRLDDFRQWEAAPDVEPRPQAVGIPEPAPIRAQAGRAIPRPVRRPMFDDHPAVAAGAAIADGPVAENFYRRAVYPLKRCYITGRDGRDREVNVLGMIDSAGVGWKADGVRVREVRLADNQHGTMPSYIKGCGLLFWENCDVNYRRPAADAVNMIRDGGF